MQEHRMGYKKIRYSTSTFRFVLGFPFGFLAECFARIANWVSGNQLDVDFNHLQYTYDEE